MVLSGGSTLGFLGLERWLDPLSRTALTEVLTGHWYATGFF
ncbi:unnamed protein product [Musa textilis]